MNSRPKTLPPEWLDSLPADEPGAQASRRDLRAFNRLLGTERWLASSVINQLKPGERVLELGAGDGAVAHAMLAAGLPWDALDLAPRPRDWSAGARWIQANALAFPPGAEHRVIVANLLLHHFDDEELARLGRRLRQCARVIVVSDLVRSRWRLGIFAGLCGIIGAHAISRHDGALSIRAGFRGDELPSILGLDTGGWTWKVTRTLMGAYRLIASKQA